MVGIVFLIPGALMVIFGLVLSSSENKMNLVLILGLIFMIVGTILLSYINYVYDEDPCEQKFGCEKYQCLSDQTNYNEEKLVYEQKLTNCLLKGHNGVLE